jgi:hypothetical protein
MVRRRLALTPAADRLFQAGIVAAMALVAAALLVTHHTGALSTNPPHKPAHVAAMGPAASHPGTVTTADHGSAEPAP